MSVGGYIITVFMESYAGEDAYIEELRRRSCLPGGFQAACVSTDFQPEELDVKKTMRMNISAILLDQPSDSFAGVFTRNIFQGTPVILGKKRMGNATTRGVLINNKIANVCTPNGEILAETLVNRFGELCGCSGNDLFPASTGVIGWKLPIDNMLDVLPELKASLQSDSILEVSRGIMTTDSFPKVRAVDVEGGRIVGIAKGAGMIEPNMATLLVFILTDIDVEKFELQRMLQTTISDTFNCISVDGDQSTSDMALVLSSKTVPGQSRQNFAKGLYEVCDLLAKDVVRNGEGTSHVMQVSVHGAPEKALARELGKAIINSPLVKTAICGNDPNVGRIIMAIGDFLGNSGGSFNADKIRADALNVSIGGEKVFANGRFVLDGRKEIAISDHLKQAYLDPLVRGYPAHYRTVNINVDLKSGSFESSVAGSDLSHEYVTENADYRT
jgi:glutamate N-acetyltransferase / amino-acid N-acetyltransferase